MIKRSEMLLAEIRKRNHQGLPIGNLFHVIAEYRRQAGYMLRKFGPKSLASFWYTKLFVPDEGGEYAISDYLVYRFFPLLLRKPAKIEIEHTTTCNKRCMFCAHTFWKGKKEQMSFEQFKKIIDDVKSLKWINIAGIGSNFLNKDFFRMIAYARQKHINVNFVDEFDFFDENMAKKVIEIGVNSIFVSFDAANRDTYETIKKGCDFEKALHNVKTLLRLKEEMRSPFPVIHFRFLITRLNYSEMPAYLEMIHSLKNRGTRARVSFTGLITFPGIEEYFMPMDEIPEEILVRTFETALKHDINLYFSHARTRLPPMEKCVRWAEPFILVNGDVISDCAILMQTRRDDLKAKSFGNVFKTPFMDIWNSDGYRKFRKTVVNGNAGVPSSCYNCCAFDTQTRAEKFGVLSPSSLSGTAASKNGKQP